MSRFTNVFRFSLLVCLLKIPACGALFSQPTREAYSLTVSPADFVAVVDNPYMPLRPGATYIYEGVTEEGAVHNEIQVLPDTKQILGVTCTVVRDVLVADGQVLEITFDWYAQDRQGNVWYFGEDTREYQGDLVISTAGSWEAGLDGALPGIMMKANPTVKDTYRQEYHQGAAEDWATIMSLSETDLIPTGYYGGLLMITEWSGLDTPPVYEQKYYAKGVGFVKSRYVGDMYELKLIEIRYE